MSPNCDFVSPYREFVSRRDECVLSGKCVILHEDERCISRLDVVQFNGDIVLP